MLGKPVETDALHPSVEIFPRAACESAAAPDWAYPSAVHLLQKPADAAISAVLELVGSAAQADRAWMFEYDDDLLRFRNTHEWARPGTRSFVEDLQDAPVTMIVWLHRHLAAGHAVMINEAGSLPRSARALQAEFLRQNDKSVLSVPIFHDGRLRACLGFDAVHNCRRWSEPEIKALFRCGDLIAAARYGGSELRGGPLKLRGALVYLRKRGGVRGVALNEIAGIRASGDFSEVWLADGSVLVDKRSMTEWMSLTPRAQFIRIHRTAIVNQRFIGAIVKQATGAWRLTIRGLESPWPVSRTGRGELRTRLGF